MTLRESVQDIAHKRAENVLPTTDSTVTLCVIGAQGAGKTCLCERFVNDTFNEEYIPSFVPSTYQRRLRVRMAESVREVDLTVRDVLGNLAYERLIGAAFDGCEGALVVFDPHGDVDHDATTLWINALFNVVGAIPLVFAVNKCDTQGCDHGDDEELERTVQSFRSTRLCTSALKGTNVERAFERLVMDILVARELERYEGIIV